MKHLLSIILFTGFTWSAQAALTIQSSTKEALSFMKSTYGTFYAPAPWKAEFDRLDLEAEYQAALAKIELQGDALTVKQARRIIMDFVYSMRDYHVSISFFSTEESRLPMVIRGAEGRYFIADLDKSVLDTDAFPFDVGDEIVTFAGQPVDDVVNQLKITEANVAETDQALAEYALTLRRASRGHIAPQGPVQIGVKRKGTDTILNRQLIWDYKPELISERSAPSLGPIPLNVIEPTRNPIVNPIMDVDQKLVDTDLAPHTLGDKKGFLPNLGEPIWQASEEDLFKAYIFQKEGENIGVIRIPGYIVEDYEGSVQNFAKLISHMEKHTTKLVIDQLNNPGGSVFYLYALASVLSDQPLRAPLHRMALSPEAISGCVSTLKDIESIHNTAEAQEKFGKSVGGYPVTYQFVQFYKEYCRTYISDWEAGKNMTRPFWIAGVDKINPYPNTNNYTKSILILVNELDFSGGDFFPTIMQDNKRAKILGVRTAGAGGYVLNYSFPNLLGVNSFRVTESLAYRIDHSTIENLGVTPDIPVPFTANDRQNNFVDYIKSVKEALGSL